MQHDVKEAREAIAEVADNNAILAAVCLTEGATALDWSTTSHKPLHMLVPAAVHAVVHAGHAVQCVAVQSVHAVYGLVHVSLCCCACYAVCGCAVCACCVWFGACQSLLLCMLWYMLCMLSGVFVAAQSVHGLVHVFAHFSLSCDACWACCAV